MSLPCHFFSSTINSFYVDTMFKILNYQCDTGTNRPEQWPQQLVWLTLWCPAEYCSKATWFSLSMIFLFFKQVSTPLSSASWNPASWARFSIDQLPLHYTVYALGSDSQWKTDSLRQDLLVVRPASHLRTCDGHSQFRVSFRETEPQGSWHGRKGLKLGHMMESVKALITEVV